MKENESVAHALAAQLRAIGLEARVTGTGVHWQVDIGPVKARALCVHCLWYRPHLAALLFGTTAANTSSQMASARRPREGAEFKVVLLDRGTRIADGRTPEATGVVGAAQAWLGGADLTGLVDEAPFIDRKGRARRVLAMGLDPRLRWEVSGDPSFDLWVYGDDRSCRLTGDGESVSGHFLLGQETVARGERLADIPAAVARWLLARSSVSELAARVPGVVLEPHAEVIEADPARWHWLHLLDRIASPNDELKPLRELIEGLAAGRVATRFYSCSSLYWLCFSASSHSPWVDAGVPPIARDRRGTYQIGEEHLDLTGAIRRIEALLEACPVQPFFGSQPHHEQPLLAACLERQGSKLRPHLEPSRGWYRLLAGEPPRQCRVSAGDVTFLTGAREQRASWPTLEEAARALVRYLEEGASFEEVTTDPRARVLS